MAKNMKHFECKDLPFCLVYSLVNALVRNVDQTVLPIYDYRFVPNYEKTQNINFLGPLSPLQAIRGKYN